jgi:chromosome segregation ATPase
MKFKNLIFTTLTIFLGVALLPSCSNDQTSKEAQKLLDKQARVLEKEQESVDDILSKFEKTRDSLEKEQRQLMNNKQTVLSEMNKLDSAKEAYAENLKEEEVSALASNREALGNRLQKIEDSINNVTTLLVDLDRQKDTIGVKEQQLESQLGSAKEKLITGIEEVDQRLDDIEKQRLVKQKELNLNQEKIGLAEKKIVLLEDEKNLYLREKNDLLRKEADDAELESYDLKIAEVDGYIQEENNKIRTARSAIRTTNAWLEDVENLEKRLRKSMEEEYDRNQTIASFTNDESERLQREKAAIESQIAELDSVQSMLAEQRAAVDNELSGVEKDLDLMKDKDLSAILTELSELETVEAEMAKREASLIGNSGEEGATLSDEMLGELESEIRARRQAIATMKAEIAAEKEQIASKRAEIQQKRAERAGAVAKTTLIIVLLGIAAVVIFYFTGLRKRKSE